MIYPFRHALLRQVVLPWSMLALFVYGIVVVREYPLVYLYGVPALLVLLWNRLNLSRMRNLLSWEDERRKTRVFLHLTTGRSIKLTRRSVILLDFDGTAMEELPWRKPVKIDEVMHTPDKVEGLMCPVPIRVSQIAVSCHGCPKSWTGTTEATGEEVYVRYRWGHLRIDVGDKTVFACQVDAETEEESKAKYAEMRKKADEGAKFPSHEMIDGMERSDKVMREFMAEHPEMNQYHSYSGDISYEEVRRLTKDWFIWPESESES